MRRTIDQRIDDIYERNVDFKKGFFFLTPREYSAEGNPIELTRKEVDNFRKGLYLLNEQNTKKPIRIEMICGGGELWSALGMFDIMSNSRRDVWMYTFGECQSSAVYLLQAAKKRIAYPNTTFMVHEGETSSDKKVNPVRRELESRELFQKKMQELLSRRSKATGRKEMKPSIWKKLLQEERFFTAKRALELGLIDEILPIPKGRYSVY